MPDGVPVEMAGQDNAVILCESLLISKVITLVIFTFINPPFGHCPGKIPPCFHAFCFARSRAAPLFLKASLFTRSSNF
jgi:hypothetical protein